MNASKKSSLKHHIYLFWIIPIGRQTVGKQMKLDLVIMVRSALNLAIMKLSFFKHEEKYKNFNKNKSIEDY